MPTLLLWHKKIIVTKLLPDILLFTVHPHSGLASALPKSVNTIDSLTENKITTFQCLRLTVQPYFSSFRFYCFSWNNNILNTFYLRAKYQCPFSERESILKCDCLFPILFKIDHCRSRNWILAYLKVILITHSFWVCFNL